MEEHKHKQCISEPEACILHYWTNVLQHYKDKVADFREIWKISQSFELCLPSLPYGLSLWEVFTFLSIGKKDRSEHRITQSVAFHRR